MKSTHSLSLFLCCSLLVRIKTVHSLLLSVGQLARSKWLFRLTEKSRLFFHFLNDRRKITLPSERKEVNFSKYEWIFSFERTDFELIFFKEEKSVHKISLTKKTFLFLVQMIACAHMDSWKTSNLYEMVLIGAWWINENGFIGIPRNVRRCYESDSITFDLYKNIEFGQFFTRFCWHLWVVNSAYSIGPWIESGFLFTQLTMQPTVIYHKKNRFFSLGFIASKQNNNSLIKWMVSTIMMHWLECYKSDRIFVKVTFSSGRKSDFALVCTTI